MLFGLVGRKKIADVVGFGSKRAYFSNQRIFCTLFPEPCTQYPVTVLCSPYLYHVHVHIHINVLYTFTLDTAYVHCLCEEKKLLNTILEWEPKYLIYLQVLDTANHFFALPILTAASNKQTAYTLHMCCWSLKLSYRGKSSEQFSLPRTALITCEWHYDHIAWLYISDKNTL